MVGCGNPCICNFILLFPLIFLCLNPFNRQTEGSQRELLVLTRERQVLVLQIEALRAEAQQAERDLQDQYYRHQTELHCLREESLQVGDCWISERIYLISLLLLLLLSFSYLCFSKHLSIILSVRSDQQRQQLHTFHVLEMHDNKLIKYTRCA